MDTKNIKLGEVRKTETALKMIFTLENDKTTTLSLKNPKANVTLTAVSDVAETMVAKEALIVGGSPIAALKDTYVQTNTITELQ